MKEEETRCFIKIENDWFTTKDNKGDTMMNKYGSLGFLIYGLVRENITLRNVSLLQISDICETLKINKLKNTVMVNKIKDVIILMNGDIYQMYGNMQLTDKLEATDKIENNKVYYCKFLHGNLENKFTIIFNDELFKLISLEREHLLEKGSLVSQFTYICKNIGNDEKEDNYKISFASEKNISDNIGASDNTIIGNNRLLTENNLMLIDNAGMNFKDNIVKNVSNTYARPEDRVQFEKRLNVQKSKVTVVNKKKEDRIHTNTQRGLKQKIQVHIKNNSLDLENLSVEQWITLNKIEREYSDFVVNIRKKKIKSGALVTIALDGVNKEYINVKEWLEFNKFQTEENGEFEITRLKSLCEDNKGLITIHQNKLDQLKKKSVNRMLYYFYNNIYSNLKEVI